MANSKMKSIVGSEREPLAEAKLVGPANPADQVEVTLRLRPTTQTVGPPSGGVDEDRAPGTRTYLTRDEYALAYGADPSDIQKVEQFAKTHGLVVVSSDAARRSVVLSGTVKSLNAAFGVSLQQFEHEGGTYRGRTGSISVPANLAGLVQGVFGLDDRPQADPHFQRYEPARGLSARAAASFTPLALAALYNFPKGPDGTGQCIGIVELGGGFRPRDLTTYFTSLGLAVPSVKAVLVDHGHNRPTNPSSADAEVMLDIEVAAAVAPKALIAVYFAPNTNQGFLDAITTAVHDNVNKPSVISISWGSPEANWTGQSMTQFDQAFQAAAAMGVTVCCAAGDNGSADGLSDGKVHVDFPASSPYALACGGTKLVAPGTAITSEVVWNEGPTSATGGGVSGFFPLPTYQAQANVPPIAGISQTGRGVPDVAADADPATGYQVLVDGQSLVIGGTSAVAPLWAGLIALMNQKLPQPVGFLNPLLYGSLAKRGVVNDIVSGNNGSYAARPGWDACTGWGSPNGAKLLQALGG